MLRRFDFVLVSLLALAPACTKGNPADEGATATAASAATSASVESAAASKPTLAKEGQPTRMVDLSRVGVVRPPRRITVPATGGASAAASK